MRTTIPPHYFYNLLLRCLLTIPLLKHILQIVFAGLVRRSHQWTGCYVEETHTTANVCPLVKPEEEKRTKNAIERSLDYSLLVLTFEGSPIPSPVDAAWSVACIGRMSPHQRRDFVDLSDIS